MSDKQVFIIAEIVSSDDILTKKQYVGPGFRYIGPFPTEKDADDWIHGDHKWQRVGRQES